MALTHEGGKGVEPHEMEQDPEVRELIKKIRSLKSEYVLGHPPVGGAEGDREDRLRTLVEEIDVLRRSEGGMKGSTESLTVLLREWQELLDWRRMVGGGVADTVLHRKRADPKEGGDMVIDLRERTPSPQESTPYGSATGGGIPEGPPSVREETQDHDSAEHGMPEEDVTMFGGLLHDLAERQVSLSEKVCAMVKQEGSTEADVRTEVDALTKERHELDEVWVELKGRYGSSVPKVVQNAYEQVVAGDEKLREALGNVPTKATPKDVSPPGETTPLSTPLQMDPIERGGRAFRGLTRTLAGVREKFEAGRANGVPGTELTALWEKVRAVEKEWGSAREGHLTEPEEDDTLAKRLFELKRDLGALEATEFAALKHTLEEMKGKIVQGIVVPPTELARVHKEWWKMQMEPWWNASYSATMGELVAQVRSAMRHGEAEPKKTAADAVQVSEEAPATSPALEEERPQPATIEAPSFREQLKDLIARQEQAGGGVEAYARFAGEVARVREQWELLYRTPPYDEEEFELCATFCRKQNLLYEDLYEGVHEDPYWRAARAEYGALKRDLENARSAYHAAMLVYYSEKPAGMLERLFVARGGKEKEEDLRAARAAYESVGAHMRDLCRSWVEVGAQREGLTDAERILEAEYARRLGARYLGKLEKEVKSTETKVAQIVAAHAAKREGGVERVARFGTAVREWCRQRSVRTTIGGLLAGFLGMAPSNIGMDVSPTEAVVAERVEPAPPDGRSPAVGRRSSGPVPEAPQAEATASVESLDERSTGETAPSKVATLVEQQAVASPTEQGPTEIVTEAPQTEASGAGAPAEPQKEVRPTKQEQPTATGEQTKSPEANYLEGTYGPGDSIERVLQHMLSDPSSPFYQPELTGEEVGRVAHLACEALKRLDQKNTAYEIAEKLGVRGGDWDKVPEGGEYAFPDLMGRIFADISRYVRSLRGALKP